MKRFAVLMLIALTGLTMLYSNVNSQERDKEYRTLRPWGKPSVHMKDNKTFVIWADKDTETWYVRWTGGGKQHNFKGTITPMNGRFTSVELHGFEWKKDSIYIDGRKIEFDGSVGKGKDGLDFQLSNSAIGIRVDVSIDGEHSVEKIWVGGKDRHPKSVPFEIVK